MAGSCGKVDMESFRFFQEIVGEIDDQADAGKREPHQRGADTEFPAADNKRTVFHIVDSVSVFAEEIHDARYLFSLEKFVVMENLDDVVLEFGGILFPQPLSKTFPRRRPHRGA